MINFKKARPVFKVFLNITVIFIIFANVIIVYSSPAIFKLLLYPTAKIVEFFTGLQFVFDPQIGFFSPDQNIIINDTSAGTNYFLIIFSLSVFIFLSKFEKYKISTFLLFVVILIFSLIVF